MCYVVSKTTNKMTGKSFYGYVNLNINIRLLRYDRVLEAEIRQYGVGYIANRSY